MSITDNNGFFKIDIEKKVGTVDLEISKPGYLTRTVSKVASDVNSILSTNDKPALMFAGDVPRNGIQDNMINMIDVMSLAVIFNSTSSDLRYSTFADFDLDESINIGDVVIIAKHYGEISSDYPAIKVVQDQTPTTTPTNTPTTTPTNTPTSTPVSTGKITKIYDDDLANGILKYSWYANVDFANTKTVKSGSKSISAEFTPNEGGLVKSI